MTRDLSIKLKACFLLIVFSLSTLVSFACAAGVDMGYNNGHHTSLPTTEPVMGHAHSKKDLNAHAPAELKESAHHKKVLAHHDTMTDQPQDSTSNDCCRDEADKFEKCDRLSPQAYHYEFQAFFITLYINSGFNSDAILASLHKPASRYFIRNHHPPIADTRIAIQSFLI